MRPCSSSRALILDHRSTWLNLRDDFSQTSFRRGLLRPCRFKITASLVPYVMLVVIIFGLYVSMCYNNSILKACWHIILLDFVESCEKTVLFKLVWVMISLLHKKILSGYQMDCLDLRVLNLWWHNILLKMCNVLLFSSLYYKTWVDYFPGDCRLSFW